MVALTTDRSTPRQEVLGKQAYPTTAATVYFAGSIVCISTATNLAVKGATATTQKCVGRAARRYDSAAGDAVLEAEAGIFRFANSSAGDLIVLGDVGADCFIVDDQTVAKTNGTNTRSRAGKVVNVDAQGVWVAMGPMF
jgi:hypothetical protein